jgi:3-isopropylmalate/(R)-2-methylmalate dehydratase small subunit
MQPFGQLEGIAAPLPLDNVDTDSIIPSRETQSVSRSGYGEKLFANWRYISDTRAPNPDFVLNRAPFDHACTLVAGHNFGCGSSREAAVWALAQFGIRCVIASSFGTIFRNNCIRNGLLPVTLAPPLLEVLLVQLQEPGGSPRVGVDLQALQVRFPQGQTHAFALGLLEREMLLHGLDEIELTLRKRATIEEFRRHDQTRRPWLYHQPTIADRAAVNPPD